eukprot:8920999-Pyramimonas_sp.AAC.1
MLESVFEVLEKIENVKTLASVPEKGSFTMECVHGDARCRYRRVRCAGRQGTRLNHRPGGAQQHAVA